MARTLTAGTRTEPRQPVDCADVVAGLWITVERLWLKGRAYGDLQQDYRKVSKRLADPRLFEHPLRPGYVLKVEGWRLELRDIDAKAEPFRRGLERQWDGLPIRIHRFLRDSGGWPEGSDGRAVANGLWRQAVEGGAYPGGECSF